MNSKTQDPELNRRMAEELPLEQIDVSDGYLFRDGSIGAYFARLRRDAPVQFRETSRVGPFWSDAVLVQYPLRRYQESGAQPQGVFVGAKARWHYTGVTGG